MIISIAIGTSYSSVCLRKGENQAEPVETSMGISIYGSKYSLPSAVFVDEDGQVLVGQAAMNSRKKKPQNFRSEFRLLLARTRGRRSARLPKRPGCLRWNSGKMRFEGQLAELAVKIKHHLSNAEHASEVIPIGYDILDYGLGRGRLNEMIAGMVSQTLECCKNILDSAVIKIEDISEILLVGGASRVPLVREMVRKFAGSTPVYADVDPDLAVAQSAAIAVALSGESKEERQENQGRSCRKCGEKDGAFMRFGGQWYCKDCLKKVMDVSTVYKKEQAVSLYLHSNIAESAVYDACMPEKSVIFRE